MLDHLKAKPEFPWNRRLTPREQHELLVVAGAVEGATLVVDESGNVAEVLRPGWESEQDWIENWERWNGGRGWCAGGARVRCPIAGP